MDLIPSPIGGDLLQRQASVLDHQDRLVAVGRQRYLDDGVRLLVASGLEKQAPRWLADLDAAGALPAAGDEVRPELAALMKIAVDLTEPGGETYGIRASRPQVVAIRVDPVLQTHDAHAVLGAQGAYDLCCFR